MCILHLPVLLTGSLPTGRFHSDWSLDPTVALGAFGLAAAYLLWTGPLNRRRPGAEQRPVSTGKQASFLIGCVAFLIALAPPMDDWADYFLLTAHMFQHIVLMFVVAPLWLAGTPGWVLEPLTRNRIVHRIGYAITRPVPALVIASAVILFWHLPGTYNAALRHEQVHVVQHLSFLAVAILAWWPVLSPLKAWPRIYPPLQCLYLFANTFPGGIAGAFITLASPGVYGFYDESPRIFGIGLATDQQLAGLMMWVGTSVIYLLWITVIFLTWAGAEEAADREPANPVARLPASGVEHA